ncbi:phosphatase PAP2 family protein [Arthrobacter sp. H41]|uniref:phosphatase PAP2 family protein n=1 Tax=Arthrobacter sp. H41 TaxID=1312978 RepID=UPI00047E4822|nr:phosphatase PAP2 family protein [Arthrobacter sp. H41]
MGLYIARSALGLLGALCLGLALTFLFGQAASGTGGRSVFSPVFGAVDFVADVGADVGWLVLPVTALWLLIRRLPSSAAFVAVAAIGSAVLTTAGPALASGLQPLVGAVIPGTGGAGLFDEGLLGLTVTVGVLLLVFLHPMPPRARVPLVVAAAVFVAAYGSARVLGGEAGMEAAIGGVLVGISWVGVGAVAFRRWRQANGADPGSWLDGLPVTDSAALVSAPARDVVLPGGRRAVLVLLGSAAGIGVALTGAGLIITNLLGRVQELDETVIEWFAGIRNDSLTVLATAIGALGTTSGVVAVLLVSAPLALAATRRWAPAIFLLAAVVGETGLYLLAGMVVGRMRPAVDHLSEGVPPTSSFPSGHVAASLVAYGGVALLLAAWTRTRWRYAAVACVPLIVIGVALSRMYWGVHYPTDALASVLYAGVWLAVCWRAFRPDRGSPHRTSTSQNFRKEKARDRR